MLFLKRRVISYNFFLKKKKKKREREREREQQLTCTKMQKNLKKTNNQTNVSLIYYSREWPFLNKAIIFNYYGLY
jgi:hypothetical protein